MSRNIEDFLNDILRYAENAEQALGAATLDEFQKDFTTSAVAIFCLQIIREAVKNIPDEVRSKYPETSWKAWAGMRDVLIHKYWEVKLTVVYDTVKDDLPALKKVIR